MSNYTLFVYIPPLDVTGSLSLGTVEQRHRRAASDPHDAGAGGGAEHPPAQKIVQQRPGESDQLPVPNTQQTARSKGSYLAPYPSLSDFTTPLVLLYLGSKTALTIYGL